MIRVALRQFRTEGIVGAVLLVLFAIVLAITGPHLVHVYDAFEKSCRAARDCATTPNPVIGVDSSLQSALPLIVTAVPALLGIFFGAPLIARELETGTYRLAWTQSITRKHWLITKLGIVGVASMVFAGLLTWMTNWWASPVNAVTQNRFGVANFGTNGIVPIGYAAFAFALGVTAGVLLRRTVPAMAVTVAGFIAARLAVTFWIRPYLASPVHKSFHLDAGSGPGFALGTSQGTLNFNAVIHNGVTPKVGAVVLTPPQVTIPNAWVYSTSVADKAGHAPSSQYLFKACPVLKQLSNPGTATPTRLQDCLNKLSLTFHAVAAYQPASRFWPFQWAEMGIYLVAAVALCGVTYWWLRRKYA
ncbi:ABC transporter permease subunit [Ferrimicrobium sp.]|uniref:ABC transporter permease n=1 Tax=Ferrimicrobium sp. TaxID=2926050 RepID=UPI002605E4A2|nr:ABC transporter permease subunit [Ferrimicrobium sp.]